MPRILLILALLLRVSAHAAPSLTLVPESRSPDGQLALAYTPTLDPDLSDDDEVFLVTPQSMAVIARVPDCFSSGGGFGARADNVRALWSKDGRHLIVNFRGGRLIGGALLFRVVGHQLMGISLPPMTSHPKARVLEVLSPGPNSGESMRWAADGSLVCVRWGYREKEGHLGEDYSAYGLPDFLESGGVLEFVFRFTRNGELQLQDIRTPKRD